MSHTKGEHDLQQAGLSRWRLTGGKLERSVRFLSYTDLIACIVRIGFLAERLNHHPDLHASWRTLRVELVTHDAGNTVTDKDLEFASKLETMLAAIPTADGQSS